MSLHIVETSGRGARFLTRLATEHLAGVTSIADSVNMVKSNHRILQPALNDIDHAVVEFNNLLQQRENPTILERELLPNSYLLREFRRSSYSIMPLPTIEELVGSKDGRCRAAFKRASDLMLAGERGETPGWSFQQNMTNLDQLIDAFALELYGLRVFPDQASLLVRALEEMLAVHRPDSRMVDSVRQFYTTEEGFSPDLVDLVNNRIPDGLQVPQVVQTTNYRMEIGEGKLVVVPETLAGSGRLSCLIDHSGLFTPRFVQGIGGDGYRSDYVVVPAASVDLTPRNLLRVLGAGRLDIPGMPGGINLTIR